MTSALYIGLISGTSVDGIDSVLAEIGDSGIALRAVRSHPYPDDLASAIRNAIAAPERCDVDSVGELDTRVGEAFRDAVAALLDDAHVPTDDVRAIGSHGQTLRHRPDAEHRFTLQIGNPAVIATGSGIDTVADFRRADVALGGQGAPLVPPFHDWLLRKPGTARVVANLGGIANLTILGAGAEPVTGFDTGPANTLLDAWIRRIKDRPYDAEGDWARSGTVDEALLDRLLSDPYFGRPAPKSTGPEHFNLDWVARAGTDGIDPADVQATLVELTAVSIARAIAQAAPSARELIVCGGGAHNSYLLERLGARLPDVVIRSTDPFGIAPDWIEASAFAWLAERYVGGRSGNLPSVTGASRATILGALYPGRHNE